MFLNRSLLNFRSRQSGITLIELTVVIFVGAIFVSMFYEFTETQLRNRQISSTRESILIISEGLYTYRLTSHTPPAPAEWPGSWADLAAYLPTFSTTGGGRNGVGQPFELLPPTPVDTLTDPFEIRTDMLTNARATRVSNEFPGQATVTGTRVTIEIPIPGHEPARDALLARDGTRAMEDALDMDGNEIENVDTVHANVLDLGNQNINEASLLFVNRLNSLNCGSSQVVTVRSGTPLCTSKGSGSGTPQNNQPTVETPPQATCPTTPPGRPSGLSSHAAWTCTPRWSVDTNGNNVCTLGCRSSCGAGDGRRIYFSWWTNRESYSPLEDVCERNSGCRSGTYSTDEGTCYVGGCRYRCRQVK